VTRHALADAPDPLGEDASTLPPPARPGAVELAAAILIVGGVLGILGTAASSVSAPPTAAVVPFLGLTVALNLASIVVGVIVRLGRLWLLAVNFVAVLGFLDLTRAGANPLALMLGVADVVALVIMFVHKPWFDALRRRRAADRETAERISP
jgi:hypothetical protein